MSKRFFFAFLIFVLSPVNTLFAQDEMPYIDPSAKFYAVDGSEDEGTSFTGSAPLRAQFFANAENTAGWESHYEWHFTLEGEEEPYCIGYIPRDENGVIAAFLEMGWTDVFECRISKKNEEMHPEYQIYLTIKIKRNISKA